MTFIARARTTLLAAAATTIFCAWPATVSSQQPNQDTLVAQFYPRWLSEESADDFNAGGPAPFRDVAYAEADLDGSGRASYIVAAFTNGFSAAVSVLAKQGTSAVEVATPSFPMMLGIHPYVKLHDVDHDGRPEVVVSFSSATGANADWVLRWQDGTLKSIGPMETDEDGDAGTLLMDALFIDLDGDGILEIVNAPDESQDDATEYEVFALVGGQYAAAPSRRLAFFDTFARPPKPATETKGREDQNSQPEVIDRTFVVPDTTVSYELTVVNGDASGAHRVTSADLIVNGTVVAGPGVLGGHRRIVTVRFTPGATNTIRAVLRGPRDTWLTIAVGPVKQP